VNPGKLDMLEKALFELEEILKRSVHVRISVKV